MVGHIVVPTQTAYSVLSNGIYLITYQQGIADHTTESERICVATLCGTRPYDPNRANEYIQFKKGGGCLTPEHFRYWFFNTSAPPPV